MKKLLTLLITFSLVQVVNCQEQTSANEHIRINQVGYTVQSPKIALTTLPVKTFAVQNVETRQTMFTGNAGIPAYWIASGDTVSTLDFSSFTRPGRYRIVLDQGSFGSYPFEIKEGIYRPLAQAAIKAFYFNRCSFPITPAFGGKWARAEGHPDTAIFVHESAATIQRPAGTIISSPGGWYDAGDYNKYIVNSGISTYTLLLFCQLYPEYCASLKTNIPESQNNLPDVLDELLVNLKWMLTMQDPNDGSVYHKLTNKGFDGFVMPDKAIDPRFVILKGTAATLDFAAVMAKASIVLKTYKQKELDVLAQTCLMAAQKAMVWANANPTIVYQQPKDVHTGGYDDNTLTDEFFWAKAELSLATGISQLDTREVGMQKANIPTWDNVNMLGILSLSLSENKDFETLKSASAKILTDYTNRLCSKSHASPYLVSIDSFAWGSNSFVANAAMLKIVAYRLTIDAKLLASAQGDLDYILGRNATGYCFVTGFGSQSPMHIHHRPSAAAGVTEPVPGFLVGGPNTATFSDCNDADKRSHFPAKAYVDALCSYSTNEIAINWNAPLFFLVGAMDGMNK